MIRTSDSPFHSIYRVNVVFSGRGKSGYAAINVKADSPKAAYEWVLSYPQYTGIPSADYLEITHSYKLRKQPVWLRKHGYVNSRFDLRKVEFI